MKKCFEVTLDNHDSLLCGRQVVWYVIADTMDEACIYVNNHKEKNWQYEIKTCVLLGDAP